MRTTVTRHRRRPHPDLLLSPISTRADAPTWAEEWDWHDPREILRENVEALAQRIFGCTVAELTAPGLPPGWSGIGYHGPVSPYARGGRISAPRY